MCATIMVLLAPKEMQNAQPVGNGVITAAILGTLVIGFLIGSLHAWLITVVGLPPFVATLATLVGLRSFGRAIVENATLAAWKAKSTQIQIYDDKFRYLATSVWIPAVLFVVLIGLLWLMLSRTVVGRHVYALGGNEQAARLSGIRTDRLKWLAYVISAMLSSLAGMLYIGDQSVADPQTLGRGYELNAIAAAVVGGCSLQGGAGTIPGTVLGALFLRTVVDGVAKIIKSGADVYEGLIVGVVVVFAVAFTQLRQAGRSGKRFFTGPLGVVAAVNLALFAGAGAALFGQKSSLGPGQIGMLTALVVLGLLMGVRWLESRRQ
jgi:ribose/xylose/arabinose/galactoside ABC-type transport system permease subunit